MKKSIFILTFLIFLLPAALQAQEMPVTPEEIAAIAPVIKKWTDFYRLDFAQARLESRNTVCFNCSPDTVSPYYDLFGKDLDTDKRIDVDYSPNRQRYVDLGLFYGYNKKGEKYELMGWDDCQEIRLIDRTQKHQNMIIFLGISGGLAEAVFWKSDDVFIVVGHEEMDNNVTPYFIYVFDIKKQIKSLYIITSEIKENFDAQAYLNKVYWKEKGIIVNERNKLK